MEWEEVAARLTGYAHIATVTPDGGPHVAKVSPAVEGDAVWVATLASSTKVRNLRAKPHAALMWEPTAEIYLWGDVEIVDDVATKTRLWKSGLFAFQMDAFFGSPDNDNFVLLRITPQRATVIGHDASGLRRETWVRPTT